MQRKDQGISIKSSLTSGEAYNTYVPNPLPPIPEIDMAEVERTYHMARLAIDALNDIVEAVPDPLVLNYMYVRKEAVLSSQIEGTQSTLDDLLRYESEQVKGVSINDVQEVSCYVAAITHGLKRLDEGFPMSLRLAREIHKILLESSRGATKTPGEFRTSQNWIGGRRPGDARFVPASPDMVAGLMGDLEKFLYNEDVPPLFRAALMHQQFETIHPFLDGNGRTGRLLITLFLRWQGVIKSPFLYLSLFFKKNRNQYYDQLDAVRHTGDWEDWINFFFDGVAVTADDARKTLLAVKKVFAAADEKIAGIGRARISAAQVLAEFKRKPLMTISEIAAGTGLSNNAVSNTVNRLISLGIIKGASERKWGQVYVYSDYADILAPDTEII
ncbi:MAG: Fic family protein [Rickettsiales bacterium]|jgi:Fic family protein|nr:Fic family protein [Rickettsiales bacterium]